MVACAAAEAIGMTAAAGAARSATALTDHGVPHATAWGLLVIVLGGLVEGTALGWLQAQALGTVLGPRRAPATGLSRRSWWPASAGPPRRCPPSWPATRPVASRRSRSCSWVPPPSVASWAPCSAPHKPRP